MGEVREEEEEKNVHKERNGEWGTRTDVWGTVAVGAKVSLPSVRLPGKSVTKSAKVEKR